MFESLGDRLQSVVSKIKGYGKITEDNISEIVREIRLALLEADVNYTVVKEFTNAVKEKALGEEVQKSLKPSEQFVKIVKDELVELLGGDKAPLITDGTFNMLMLVGLQGSGKTTTLGKLANLLRKKYNKKPLLVACDIYRPAAIDQLKQIGSELNIEFFEEGKVAFTYITQADMQSVDAKTGDHEGIVEIGRNVEDVEVSVFAREIEDGWRLSLRSNQYINVSDVCIMFGGGGHPRAAGATITGNIEEVKEKILTQIKRYIRK